MSPVTGPHVQAAEARSSANAVQRHSHLLLFGVLGLAFALRLTMVLLGRDVPLNDALAYHVLGDSIARGDGYTNLDGSPAIKWVPGWSAMLAAVYAVFGNSVRNGCLLNAFLGTATVGFLFGIGKRLFDVRIGLVAALLYAIWPGVLSFTPTLMSETAFAFMVTSYLWLLILAAQRDSPSAAAFAGVGVSFGATMLVREEAIALIPATLGFLWVHHRARSVRPALLVFGVAALTILPWTLRNYATFGRIIPTSANSGIAFFHANNPDARGEGNYKVTVNFRKRHLRENQSLTTIASNDAGWREGFAFVRSNPAAFLRLIPNKLHTTYGNDQQGAWIAWRKVQQTVERESALGRWLTLTNLYWFTVLTLALLGIATYRRWPTDARVLLLGSFGVLFLMHVVMQGNPRYHFTETPLLALFAAWGIRSATEANARTHADPSATPHWVAAALLWTTLGAIFGSPLPAAAIESRVEKIVSNEGDGRGHRLESPGPGLDTDAAGNVYVTGTLSDNVFRITPKGAVTEIINRTGDGTHGLERPEGLAVGPHGQIVVAGRGSSNLFTIDADGNLRTLLPRATDGPRGPSSLAFAPDGTLWMAAGAPNVGVSIHRLRPGAEPEKLADQRGDGEDNFLSLPLGISSDAAGNAYVAGANTNNAFRISPDGTVQMILDGAGDRGGQILRKPQGTATDPHGNVYVLGSRSRNVFRVSRDGHVEAVLDRNGDGRSRLFGTGAEQGIAADSAGNIYVSSVGTNNVFRVSPQGAVTEILNRNGDRRGSEMTGPSGIAFSPDGATVYVAADQGVFAVVPPPVPFPLCWASQEDEREFDELAAGPLDLATPPTCH